METKYQVLAKDEDWEKGTISHLEITAGRVRLEPVHALMDEITFQGVVPGGVAVGRDRLYLIDTDGDRIIIHELRDTCVQDHVFGSTGNQPYRFKDPGAIAADDELVYVVDTGNNRVQVFYPNLTLKTIWYKAGGMSFDSLVDLAFDQEGNAYVADRGNKRIVKIEKDGIDSIFCSSEDGELSDPVALTLDDDGSVYIVDADRKSILVYSGSGDFNAEIKLDNYGTLKDIDPTCILYHDKGLFVGDSGNKRLHRINTSGSYEFAIRDVIHTPYRLAAGENGDLYVTFTDYEHLSILSKIAFRKTGYYYGVFDSKQQGCQWHRILLDIDIMQKSRLVIKTHTSDDPILTEDLSDEWDSMTFEGGFSAGDMLVQNLPGRYLGLKIIFESDGTLSPILRSLHVYYPRETYLKYLPAIYQQDPDSLDFLSRFLPIFESFMLSIDDKVSNSSRYYNPLAAPDHFLTWLASWLDFSLDDKWSEEKKRRLIMCAVSLYRKRGTVEGLLDYIEMYTGYRPAIIELFKLRSAEKKAMLSHHVVSLAHNSIPMAGYVVNDSAVVGRSTLADEWDLHLPGDYAHRFMIFLYPVHRKDEITQRTVHRILDMEKPAHTQYFCCKIEPMMRVGEQSMIGLDTIIAKDPDELVVGKSFTIGGDSIINRKNAGSGFIVEKRSNIGADVII